MNPQLVTKREKTAVHAVGLALNVATVAFGVYLMRKGRPVIGCIVASVGAGAFVNNSIQLVAASNGVLHSIQEGGH